VLSTNIFYSSVAQIIYSFVPHLSIYIPIATLFFFFSTLDRLNEDRFSKYFCNKRDKEYTGCPKTVYENPNEELGEGIILIEKGEYQCKICNNIIAIYRKFN